VIVETAAQEADRERGLVRGQRSHMLPDLLLAEACSQVQIRAEEIRRDVRKEVLHAQADVREHPGPLGIRVGYERHGSPRPQ